MDVQLIPHEERQAWLTNWIRREGPSFEIFCERACIRHRLEDSEGSQADRQRCYDRFDEGSIPQVLAFRDLAEETGDRKLLRAVRLKMFAARRVERLLRARSEGEVSPLHFQAYLDSLPRSSLLPNATCILLLSVEDERVRLDAVQQLIRRGAALGVDAVLEWVSAGTLSDADATELLLLNSGLALKDLRQQAKKPEARRLLKAMGQVMVKSARNTVQRQIRRGVIQGLNTVLKWVRTGVLSDADAIDFLLLNPDLALEALRKRAGKLEARRLFNAMGQPGVQTARDAVQRLIRQGMPLGVDTVLEWVKIGALSDADATELLLINSDFALEHLQQETEGPEARRLLHTVGVTVGKVVRVGDWIHSNLGWGCIRHIEKLPARTQIRQMTWYPGKRILCRLGVVLRPEIHAEAVTFDLSSASADFSGSDPIHTCTECEAFSTQHKDLLKRHFEVAHPPRSKREAKLRGRGYFSFRYEREKPIQLRILEFTAKKPADQLM